MNKNARLELLGKYYAYYGFNFSQWQIECLQRIARAAQRNAINLCNEPDYKDKRDQLMTRLDKVFTRDIVERITIDGVPRGFVLKIARPGTLGDLCPEYFN